MNYNSFICADVMDGLKRPPMGSAQTCVTSPPYWGLRDYGQPGQIGLEKTPEEYIKKMVQVFRVVRHVLKDDGTVWLNLGDSYANDTKWGGSSGGKHAKALHGNPGGLGREKRMTGLKPKDLIGIPWRVALALQADGWYLRCDIIWSKPNPMPESVRDRPTKSHEYLFLLSKNERYYYDSEAIKEKNTSGDHESDCGGDYNKQSPGQKRHAGFTKMRRSGNKERKSGDARGRPGSRLGASIPWWDVDGKKNKRSVWTIPTQPYPGAHFATFPQKLVEPCILACSREGDVVLDPFGGSGTTAYEAYRLGRKFVYIDNNAEYVGMAKKRLLPLMNQTNLFQKGELGGQKRL